MNLHPHCRQRRLTYRLCFALIGLLLLSCASLLSRGTHLRKRKSEQSLRFHARPAPPP